MSLNDWSLWDTSSVWTSEMKLRLSTSCWNICFFFNEIFNFLWFSAKSGAHGTVPPYSWKGGQLELGAVQQVLASLLAFWPVLSWTPALLPRLLGPSSTSLPMEPGEACSVICLLVSILLQLYLLDLFTYNDRDILWLSDFWVLSCFFLPGCGISSVGGISASWTSQAEDGQSRSCRCVSLSWYWEYSGYRRDVCGPVAHFFNLFGENAPCTLSLLWADRAARRTFGSLCKFCCLFLLKVSCYLG